MLTNYRPISLTSSSCKLLEHIISNYINDFLDKHEIISPFQHGFRKGLSTTTQLISTIHSFASIVDRPGQVDVIFLDFSKAFDRVPHSGLIYKLNEIGLPSTVVQWISAYLQMRKQFVDVVGHHSDPLPVISGVPQGSVLGPLLFSIFINDLTFCIDKSVSIRLFADDCLLFKDINSTRDQVVLNESLNAVSSWCDRWEMKLNQEKSLYMRITNKKSSHQYEYFIGDNYISRTMSFKYLGITISSNLSWSSHIEHVCAAARRKLGMIRHKLKHVPSHVKLLAYNTLIRTKLEYACTVWDPFTKKDIKILEDVQKQAARFIFNRYHPHDSPAALIQSNNIISLESRRKLARLKFLYQLWFKKLRLESSSFLHPSSTRRTRHDHPHKITPVFARTNAFKYSFFPRTITEWNNLPHHIFISDNVLESIERLFDV